MYFLGDLTVNLKKIGWSPSGAEKKIEVDTVARIISVHRGFCRGITQDGDVNVYLTGKFQVQPKSSANKPAVGDFVRISPIFIDEQNSHAAALEEILTRKTKVSRIASGREVVEQVLATNVEFAFIVTSANQDFNINRLQRYILLAKEGNVTPVIILSKIDLVDGAEPFVSEIRDHIGDLEVIPVSSITDVGLALIRKKLDQGVTSVFLGSSGVGKSTIVNKLLGEKIQVTKDIREDDSKGRHATTSRELFFVPNGGMIIDTAGLREVQVIASKEAVDSTFKNISELAQTCRFSDCAHEKEPHCAINAALEDGTLSEKEYGNYLKLLKEAAFAEKKTSNAKSNTKERWKTINKNYKARRKFEGK